MPGHLRRPQGPLARKIARGNSFGATPMLIEQHLWDIDAVE